jgi:DNA damage-inducible protein 1
MAPVGHFPGQGRTLGDPPAAPQQQPSTPQPAPQPAQQSQFKEEDIKSLMDLGVGRAEAIQYLEVAGGNVEAAASMLFQG